MIIPWWRRRAAAAPPLQITLYKHARCPLCNELEMQLAHLQSEFQHVVEIVDTEQATELDAFFRENVPVLAISGKVRLWGRIAPGLLRRELHAAQKAARRER